ncbi:hypothetical protein, partial [Tistrella mobilis]|uniref:hypothetical protein n=1 Tax=Tistrella mobilis TaxID=171437 RepID=UPI001E45A7F3
MTPTLVFLRVAAPDSGAFFMMQRNRLLRCREDNRVPSGILPDQGAVFLAADAVPRFSLQGYLTPEPMRYRHAEQALFSVGELWH